MSAARERGYYLHIQVLERVSLGPRVVVDGAEVLQDLEPDFGRHKRLPHGEAGRAQHRRAGCFLQPLADVVETGPVALGRPDQLGGGDQRKRPPGRAVDVPAVPVGVNDVTDVDGGSDGGFQVVPRALVEPVKLAVLLLGIG